MHFHSHYSAGWGVEIFVHEEDAVCTVHVVQAVWLDVGGAAGCESAGLDVGLVFEGKGCEEHAVVDGSGLEAWSWAEEGLVVRACEKVVELDEASSQRSKGYCCIESPDGSSKGVSNPIYSLPTDQPDIIDAHVVNIDHIDEIPWAIDQSSPEILLAILLAHEIGDGGIGEVLEDDAAEGEGGVVLVDSFQFVDPAGICVFGDARPVDEGGEEFAGNDGKIIQIVCDTVGGAVDAACEVAVVHQLEVHRGGPEEVEEGFEIIEVGWFWEVFILDVEADVYRTVGADTGDEFGEGGSLAAV